MTNGRLTRLMIAGACFLAGCSTTRVMDGVMASWSGAPLTAVVAQWGYPHEQRPFNGNTLYIWHHEKSAYIPPTATASATPAYAKAQATGGYNIEGSCTRILEVGPDERVRAWEWRGNNCPFAERFEYAAWRRR